MKMTLKNNQLFSAKEKTFAVYKENTLVPTEIYFGQDSNLYFVNCDGINLMFLNKNTMEPDYIGMHNSTIDIANDYGYLTLNDALEAAAEYESNKK